MVSADQVGSEVAAITNQGEGVGPRVMHHSPRDE